MREGKATREMETVVTAVAATSTPKAFPDADV